MHACVDDLLTLLLRARLHEETCLVIPCFSTLYGEKTLYSIPARLWSQFLRALDDTSKIICCPPGLWPPRGAKVTSAGARRVAHKQEIPNMPASHKPSCLRLQGLTHNECHLVQDSQPSGASLAAFLHATCAATASQLPPLLHMHVLRQPQLPQARCPVGARPRCAPAPNAPARKEEHMGRLH